MTPEYVLYYIRLASAQGKQRKVDGRFHGPHLASEPDPVFGLELQIAITQFSVNFSDFLHGIPAQKAS